MEPCEDVVDELSTTAFDVCIQTGLKRLTKIETKRHTNINRSDTEETKGKKNNNNNKNPMQPEQASSAARGRRATRNGSPEKQSDTTC